MYGELSDRKKAILQAVIDAYIESGDPVGSRTLTEGKHRFDLSSATIRNEMAELEALGYLVQPHTSAGRVPTDAAYRFYVDTLMREYSLTSTEVAQLNKAIRTKTAELDRIIKDAGKVISNLTNYPAIALSPAVNKSSVLRFSVTRADERSFLLVAILEKNKAKTRFINCESDIPDSMLDKLELLLNAYVAGHDIRDITLSKIMEMESELGDYGTIVTPIMKYICDMISGNDSGEVRINGVGRLLEYPEYSDTDKLREILGFMESKEDIIGMVSESEVSDDVSVLIGSESESEVLKNSAVVFKKIVVGGQVVGAIGVIGPTRMDYSKVISTIRYLSDCIEGRKSELGDGKQGDGGDANE